MRYVIPFVVTCVLVVDGTPIVAQRAPSIAIDSLVGRDSYDFYCAPCHGGDGRGSGPVALALSTAPADLTKLAIRNGGMFPREEVRKYVTGGARAIPAHGTTDMPVWGPMFRAFEGDARVRTRIDNLIDYLERLQERTARRDDRHVPPATN